MLSEEAKKKLREAIETLESAEAEATKCGECEKLKGVIRELKNEIYYLKQQLTTNRMIEYNKTSFQKVMSTIMGAND